VASTPSRSACCASSSRVSPQSPRPSPAPPGEGAYGPARRQPFAYDPLNTGAGSPRARLYVSATAVRVDDGSFQRSLLTIPFAYDDICSFVPTCVQHIGLPSIYLLVVPKSGYFWDGQWAPRPRARLFHFVHHGGTECISVCELSGRTGMMSPRTPSSPGHMTLETDGNGPRRTRCAVGVGVRASWSFRPPPYCGAPATWGPATGSRARSRRPCRCRQRS
jgi:hypothetical protein